MDTLASGMARRRKGNIVMRFLTWQRRNPDAAVEFLGAIRSKLELLSPCSASGRVYTRIDTLHTLCRGCRTALGTDAPARRLRGADPRRGVGAAGNGFG